ncbi:MAG TPA: ABC transporter permease, partial [Spirochaetia bacterium]|nr:ABC transporter permease [Spirochaetia bacterium]
MRLLRLFLVFFRIGAMGELAYRANFFLQLLESAVDLGTALGGLAVVFSYTSTLGGWRAEEVVALIGVFFLVGGAIRLVVQP